MGSRKRREKRGALFVFLSFSSRSQGFHCYHCLLVEMGKKKSKKGGGNSGRRGGTGAPHNKKSSPAAEDDIDKKCEMRIAEINALEKKMAGKQLRLIVWSAKCMFKAMET